jgi:Met-zincin/Domain of unknown function (DUF5117)
MNRRRNHLGWRGAALAAVATLSVGPAQARELPPFEQVSDGYTKVVSTADGAASLYTIYRNDKDSQLLAELPGSYAGQKLFIATSIAGGGEDTGFQWSDMYVYWKRIGDRLVLMEPNLDIRTDDREAGPSIARTFTDRVILDVPIVSMGPSGGPVIDLDQLLLGHGGEFFGRYLAGARSHLATIAKTKAFPQNVEIAFELPRSDGQLTTVHYSLSALPEHTGYQPRRADQRIGYFTTTYRDLGLTDGDSQWVRYITRWNLQKRDPGLKLSPPQEPIVFYIDHTTPVRYRRWVRDGILAWNKAFEKIGIVNAVEVYYQDAQTGANMEKDPEDVRYNFIRWTTADLGFAYGPSRVDPRTGQILDADIIMDQSWIAHYVNMQDRYIGQLAEQSMHPASLAWLERHPSWDFRLTAMSPLKREQTLRERARRLASGEATQINPLAAGDGQVIGDDRFDGLAHRQCQINGRCELARMRAMDVALVRSLGAGLLDGSLLRDEGEEDDAADEEETGSVLDGLPEEFIGPLVAEVITHEVGHTLGLMHNFKASSIYTFEEINSEEWGDKPITGSIMEYYPLNLTVLEGTVQGDWGMLDIGPYDLWAIEYGYTFDEGSLGEILGRCAEPELAYGNDIDSFGPDPLCRTFDLGSDPLVYCQNRIELAHLLRDRIFESVEDGDSWEQARTMYEITLSVQSKAIAMPAPWIGGVHIHRDHKGDPGERDPAEVVSVEQQRRAMQFMIDNAFDDDDFGLTPELLAKMGIDKWWDAGGIDRLLEGDAYAVHQNVAAVQSMALTLLMDPFRLEQVYDNEFRVPAEEDALTLPEVIGAVADAVWSELEETPGRKLSNRRPHISNLRRDLQREHLNRLVDLATPGTATGAAANQISNLAVFTLRNLQVALTEQLDGEAAGRLDDYSLAHLTEAHALIERTLDATYIYNADQMSGGGGMPFLLFQPTSE